MVSAPAHDLKRAIEKLKSLHHGDLGVVETVACGARAIPPLRALLFEREPSGLFETRCRAVQALAALNARDVLVEYLAMPHEAPDPVEQLGDDAVLNAAARAVAKYGDEQVFQLLRHLAGRRLLPGVVGGLGEFIRPEAIPYLVDALAEDECRLSAEAALKKFGRRAYGALKRVATASSPESPSRTRQRQSALGLLAAMNE
jgi:HEAT repeat protein